MQHKFVKAREIKDEILETWHLKSILKYSEKIKNSFKDIAS